MSGSLLQPVDLQSLATRGTILRDGVSLNQLHRLVEALPAEVSNGAPIDCVVAASRDQADQVTLRGSLKTRWFLLCQRCLGEVDYDVDVSFCWVFRRDDSSAFRLSDEPVSLVDYIEDELLLELPQIPKHANETDCEAAVSQYLDAAEEGEAPALRTPFSGLKELLRGEDS